MTTKRLWGLGAVLLLTGLLAAMIGCSENEYVARPPVEEGVGPDGGTVASTDGNAQILIPPGALEEVIEFTVVPASQPPAGFVQGTAYDFGPDGIQFSLPVSITIGYDPAELPGSTSPQDLQLCQVVGGIWVPLGSYTVDDQAHTLSAATNHFSTYGIVIDDEGPVETSTAYLTDSPNPQNPEEFDDLAEAMGWLENLLGPEDQGTLVWQTSTAQQIESLAFSFDWVIEVAEGAEPAIEGPAGLPLVIDAGGAIDLSAFDITAAAGLVVNANRAISIAGCNLPDDVLVNIGGVKGAPFPAGDPSYLAKSDRADKLSRGTAVFANRVANSLNVQIGGAESVDGSISVTENQVPRLTIGGQAVLFPDVALIVAGPPSVPTPYPNISANLGGNSSAVIRNFEGTERLVTNLKCTGHNVVSIRDIEARVHLWGVLGTGTPTLQLLNATVDSASIIPTSSTVELTLSNVINQSGMFVHAQDVTGNVDVTVEGGTYGRDLQVNLPAGGNSAVNLTGSTHTGGQLVIGSEGGSSVQTSGGPASVTLTDLAWSGSALADHIDIFGVDCPVNIAGGNFSHSGAPAVILGLTEIGGAITIEDATFNGAGIGLVDCTGAATLTGTDLTVTSGAAYGLSMGGCAAVTVQDCSIIGSSGGIGVIQTGEMNGDVTITGCTLNGATSATLATFAGSNVTMDDNPLLSGSIFIIDSQVHMSGNTFSAALVMDDYADPGLQNDPVQDNDGLLPGMCYTRMDWDGNGCCDYPPEWNVIDEFGACAVCQGVGGKALIWR